jgi:hypothetical protein
MDDDREKTIRSEANRGMQVQAVLAEVCDRLRTEDGVPVYLIEGALLFLLSHAADMRGIPRAERWEQMRDHYLRAPV